MHLAIMIENLRMIALGRGKGIGFLRSSKRFIHTKACLSKMLINFV